MSLTNTVALPPVIMCCLLQKLIMAHRGQNGTSHFMGPLDSRISVPDVILDRHSREPLYEQITRQIALAIREGKLGRDARLPSTRVLARLLGVSRNIVMAAYETLANEGLVESRPGSGTRIRAYAPVAVPPLRRLLSLAMYPEHLSLFSDLDGNRFYFRHPDLR